MQELVLLNADPSDPPALFNVEIAELASVARFFTCGASVATAAVIVATEALPWSWATADLAVLIVVVMSVES